MNKIQQSKAREGPRKAWEGSRKGSEKDASGNESQTSELMSTATAQGIALYF